MKNLFFSFIALFAFAFTSSAQSKSETQIREQVQSYFQATMDKNWDAVMDGIYPKIFNETPRAQIISMFRDMENRGMDMNFTKMDIEEVSKIEKSGEEKFALVSYSSAFTIQFLGEEYHTIEVMNMMEESFYTSYGRENVEFSAEEYLFKIKAEKQIFAVSDKKSDDWKFIEYTTANSSKMDLYLPLEVRTALLGE